MPASPTSTTCSPRCSAAPRRRRLRVRRRPVLRLGAPRGPAPAPTSRPGPPELPRRRRGRHRHPDDRRGPRITTKIPPASRTARRSGCAARAHEGDPGAPSRRPHPHRVVEKHPVFGRDGDNLTVDLPGDLRRGRPRRDGVGADARRHSRCGSRSRRDPQRAGAARQGSWRQGRHGTGDLLAKVSGRRAQRLTDTAREAVEALRAEEADGRPAAGLFEQAERPEEAVTVDRSYTPFSPDDDTPVFVISVAAELAGMHAQTLRQYDRLGLVSPVAHPRRRAPLLPARRRAAPRGPAALAGGGRLAPRHRRILELENQVEAAEPATWARAGERGLSDHPLNPSSLMPRLSMRFGTDVRPLTGGTWTLVTHMGSGGLPERDDRRREASPARSWPPADRVGKIQLARRHQHRERAVYRGRHGGRREEMAACRR